MAEFTWDLIIAGAKARAVDRKAHMRIDEDPDVIGNNSDDEFEMVVDPAEEVISFNKLSLYVLTELCRTTMPRSKACRD